MFLAWFLGNNRSSSKFRYQISETLPQEIATQKILTELFPPISFIAFLHLTLRFDKFS